MDNTFTSDSLTVGNIYTREQLKHLFNITDATINTGIFKPKGHNSIWLFITEDKTSDRTQYRDKLSEHSLSMQGQTSGRTDQLIISHQEKNVEILLFHRKKKYDHAKAGFAYEGQFAYALHAGEKPTNFTLNRVKMPLAALSPEAVERKITAANIIETKNQLDAEQEAADNDKTFDLHSVEDERKKVLRAIVIRQGQLKFRKALLSAYQKRCAITGCRVEAILEAAHIHPYKGEQTNLVANGILLRADIHTLFDLGLICIDPESLQVQISNALKGTEYEAWHASPIHLPVKPADHPNVDALRWRSNQSATDK